MTFIALTAGVDPRQMAIASSGLYLSSTIGMVGGLSIAAAVLQETLRKQLRISLEGMDGMDPVLKYFSMTRDINAEHSSDYYQGAIGY